MDEAFNFGGGSALRGARDDDCKVRRTSTRAGAYGGVVLFDGIVHATGFFTLEGGPSTRPSVTPSAREVEGTLTVSADSISGIDTVTSGSAESTPAALILSAARRESRMLSWYAWPLARGLFLGCRGVVSLSMRSVRVRVIARRDEGRLGD